MGCGTSKLKAGGATIPPRLRPILWRRLEDIRKRRTINSINVTPSQKKLLVHEKDDENDSEHQDPRKSLSSSEDTIPSDGLKGASKEEHDETIKRRASAVEDHQNVEPAQKIAGQEVAKEEVKVMDGADGNVGNEADNEDDDGTLSHQEGEEIFPGSPSFRVFFTDNNMNDNDNEEKDEGLDDTYQSGDTASPTSDLQEPLGKKVKKERKRRNFRRVISKGGQVKNLLNVRSCYSSHCLAARSAHRHPHNLLTEKTAA